MLIPVRKPRPFAGKRGQSLKDLYSTCIGRALGIAQIKVVNNEYNTRYNTEAVIATKMDGETVTERQSTLYRRLSIKEVFKLAKFNTPDGDVAPVKDGVVVTHPMTTKQVLDLLNGPHKCDFEEADVTITHVTGSQYTITAKAESLGYYGTANLSIGTGAPVISCAGAPASVELPFTSTDEGGDPSVEVTIEGVVVYTGEVGTQEFFDAMLASGVKAILVLPNGDEIDSEVIPPDSE